MCDVCLIWCWWVTYVQNILPIWRGTVNFTSIVNDIFSCLFIYLFMYLFPYINMLLIPRRLYTLLLCIWKMSYRGEDPCLFHSLDTEKGLIFFSFQHTHIRAWGRPSSPPLVFFVFFVFFPISNLYPGPIYRFYTKSVFRSVYDSYAYIKVTRSIVVKWVKIFKTKKTIEI